MSSTLIFNCFYSPHQLVAQFNLRLEGRDKLNPSFLHLTIREVKLRALKICYCSNVHTAVTAWVIYSTYMTLSTPVLYLMSCMNIDRYIVIGLFYSIYLSTYHQIMLQLKTYGRAECTNVTGIIIVII